MFVEEEGDEDCGDGTAEPLLLGYLSRIIDRRDEKVEFSSIIPVAFFWKATSRVLMSLQVWSHLLLLPLAHYLGLKGALEFLTVVVHFFHLLEKVFWILWVHIVPHHTSI